MRVPLSWLKDFTPLATDPRRPEEVAELVRALDSLGLVVEEVTEVGEGLEQVVLARVLEIAPIAGADRIRRVLVDAGKPEPLEIVCGAWNFSVGDVVPLAPVGTVLPNGLRIEERTLRGAKSRGMLCSARELGLGDDAAGLFVVASPGSERAPLPPGLQPGTSLAEHLGVGRDVVLDIAVEPNRPDALSIVGVARDLAARLGLPFVLPEPTVAASGPPVASLATARVLAGAGCRRLVVRVLEGVVALASPPKVQRRLALAGMRPINAVVDASNYVMLELGQPTHPYDLDRLEGAGIEVRFAQPGERLVTLDGVERALVAGGDDPATAGDLVIADAEGHPVGLAGVLGGASSEIGEGTRRVLLEVADFDPIVVGRSAQRHGLRSEASVRFWRGIDPEGLVRAADRVCELVAEAMAGAPVAGFAVASGRLDVRVAPPAEPRRVLLRVGRCNSLLGTSLRRDEVAALLAPIGFSSVPAGEDLLVEVPSFRPDTTREVDVVEEVARHLGYERIAPRQRRSPYVGRLTEHQLRRRALRRLLAGTGCHEAWTSSIVDPAAAGRLGVPVSAVAIANPLVREESALRTHLLPGLLGALRHNAAYGNPELRLFELGRVFRPGADASGRPDEREHLGVLLARRGDDATGAVSLWRFLAEGLAIDPASVRLAQGEDVASLPLALGCHLPRTAALRDGAGSAFGVVGEVRPDVLAAFDLAGRRVGWLALDVDALLALGRRSPVVRPVSRFPASDVDLAFTLDDAVPAAELEAVLAQAAGAWCESLTLLDVYRGPGLPTGARSLAFRLRLRAPDRTLTDAEIAEVRERAVGAAGSALGARLRA
ncbi:MAG TPA: phenylalanine--tRNA ligase subunit beta [Acidimicrobiales bacterium]|nr:phenylalanine--tRNA ligase subunit beta [Acidimicrobiales bacterium]